MASKLKTGQKDDFQFSLLDSFLGYNSANDKTKLDPRFLIRGSKNVYKKISGTIASRPGLKRRGATDTTAAGVKSSFEWETSVGTKRYVRVANGKLEVESDIVTAGTRLWYELKLTSTLASLAGTYTRFVFSTWWDNDDKTDRLVMARGDSFLLYWSGGMAKVLSSTATTITLSGTKTWAELGFAITLSGEKKIIVDGREATYTGGESTTTLTGVTMSSGDASTIPVDSVAIQAVFSQAGGAGSMFPAGYLADFVLCFNNQMVVGSYSSRVVYLSADVTTGGTLGFLNYTNTVGLVVGDPDGVILDSPARGLGITNTGKLAIFAGVADLYIVTPNYDLPVSQAAVPITGGNARNVIAKVEKKKLPGLQSALGHEFIDNHGEYMVWLDQENQVRALGTFTDSPTIKPVHLSIQVQEELKEDDFTGGHLRSIGNTIHITAPNNGRDWMYDVREIVNDQGQVESEKIWQPPQIRGISRFAVMDGVTHGHSNVNPQVYQVWDTNQWTDDNPSEDLIPYTCVARFAYRQLLQQAGSGVFERRQGMLSFDKIYFEGYMPQGVYLNVNVFSDYQGAKAKREFVINSPEDPTITDDYDDLAVFYTGNMASSLGDASLGDNPLGDGILEESSEQELVPKFRRIVGVGGINCFEYCLEVFSTEEDSRWELLALGPNTARASQQPTFLRVKK